MQRENANVARQITAQQCQLAIRGERQRRFARQPEFRPEPERTNDGISRRVEQNGQHLKRLRKLQPQKRHDEEYGVVKQSQKRQPSVTQNHEEGAQQVEKA